VVYGNFGSMRSVEASSSEFASSQIMLVEGGAVTSRILAVYSPAGQDRLPGGTSLSHFPAPIQQNQSVTPEPGTRASPAVSSVGQVVSSEACPSWSLGLADVRLVDAVDVPGFPAHRCNSVLHRACRQAVTLSFARALGQKYLRTNVPRQHFALLGRERVKNNFLGAGQARSGLTLGRRERAAPRPLISQTDKHLNGCPQGPG
jgi:hypothetical protein